jgi:hypothetical protein
MKESYTGKLRCATCGDTESFEYNDDKSYIKCVKCNREYFGGYDELLSYNQETIEEVKGQIEADAEAYIRKSLEDTFKGNNFFKIK